MSIIGATDLGPNVCAAIVDHDPTSSATDLPKGSIIVRTDSTPPELYLKNDDGSTTNVTKFA